MTTASMGLTELTDEAVAIDALRLMVQLMAHR